MAIAMNYIAKGMGVTRGMHMREVARICPDAAILDADHASYELFSQRMNNIIGRYAPLLDRYSIDESFADITNAGTDVHAIGSTLKSDLKRELGMTFSVGIAPTKVLAKLASNFKKPDGLTMIPLPHILQFLSDTPIEKIWGIGPHTASFLRASGILTAGEFIHKPKDWVVRTLAKPYQEIWHELRGESILPFATRKPGPQQSFMRTRTFTPPSSDKRFLLSELSRHIEVLCTRLRSDSLAARQVSFFLKTQTMRYIGTEAALSRGTNIPEEILSAVTPLFNELWREGVPYRAVGTTLLGLVPEHATEQNLFDIEGRSKKLEQLYTHIDALCSRYGKSVVYLASSTHEFASEHMESDALNQESWDRTGIPMIGAIN
jgi:DNA polymerase-4/DNA polymerase V